jgi:hypothetical protein
MCGWSGGAGSCCCCKLCLSFGQSHSSCDQLAIPLSLRLLAKGLRLQGLAQSSLSLWEHTLQLPVAHHNLVCTLPSHCCKAVPHWQPTVSVKAVKPVTSTASWRLRTAALYVQPCCTYKECCAELHLAQWLTLTLSCELPLWCSWCCVSRCVCLQFSSHGAAAAA